MSIPSGVLKYAGIWSVANPYLYADFVVSPIDSLAYVLVIPTLTGGTDPSTPSASWVNIPNGGGGGGITSLNGLDSGDNAGILQLVSADGSVTFTVPTPSSGEIDASVTYPTVVDQLNGLTGSVSLTSPLNTITIGITGNDIELEVTNPVPNDIVNTITAAGTTLSGAISLTAGTGIILTQPAPQTFTIAASPIVVQTGQYTEATGGLSTATITASTCDNASIIQLTYIHVGTGGASQFIKDIVPNIGSFTVVTNTAIDLGDRINWMVSVA
jgi:hypothetical protein